MSRLLAPNPGECIDRQTILEIKAEHGQKLAQLKDGTSAVDVSHFLDEHRSIQKYLEVNWFLLVKKDVQPKFNEYVGQLKVVNRKLWQLEDKIRDLKTGKLNSSNQLEDIRDTAFEIVEMNDIRARLVVQVNQLFGIQTKEKFYV